ncbi:hypothetical protein ACH41H_46475 [Streptomyces sp. NPDC020800]|uniref:hypothetical protein n=1 Tax=Streptomyces sp. NPDC020800 TaxID=3365092 RepID=UPI0037AE98EF
MSVVSGGIGVDGWYVFTPSSPVAATAPVTVITHGYGEFSGYSTMRDLIRHTVRQGNIVIYPRWQTCGLCPRPDMEQPLASAARGIKGALNWLMSASNRTRPRLNTTSYFGFSYGGMITVNLINRYKKLGLPEPHVVMVDEPSGGPVGDQFDTDLSGIPSETRFSCLVSQWSAEHLPTHGCYSFWNRLGHLPDRHKTFVLVHSDAHGTPALNAVHGMSTSDPVDAIDYYAVWKIWDAERACALSRVWCQYSNNSALQRYMGRWSDGVPVIPLHTSDRPVAA